MPYLDDEFLNFYDEVYKNQTQLSVPEAFGLWMQYRTFIELQRIRTALVQLHTSTSSELSTLRRKEEENTPQSVKEVERYIRENRGSISMKRRGLQDMLSGIRPEERKECMKKIVSYFPNSYIAGDYWLRFINHDVRNWRVIPISVTGFSAYGSSVEIQQDGEHILVRLKQEESGDDEGSGGSEGRIVGEETKNRS